MGPVGASLSRRCGRPLGVGFFAVPRWHCCFPHPAAGSRINGLPWLQFLAEKCEALLAPPSCCAASHWGRRHEYEKGEGVCWVGRQQGSNQSSIRIQSHHSQATGTIASASTATP